ncbi:hypothetical protein EUTSA_v10029305mg [Eutrema salsugineum]|uniref:Ubiquitin-like domain-containing protein n=2 Tax=Eutrema salsugineum TaxID=72664 RepID=V4KJF4_EUTSA|nr:hypothetical protein EUTSA_v10029305mg [Eutrema salsugineum]
MEVFVDTSTGVTFSIELGYFDTVLDIKRKIEKSQRIPVSYQNLVFQGEFLTHDDFLAKVYNIVDKSRLQLLLVIPDDHNNSQVLQQAEPSPVPSASFEDWLHEKNQDSTSFEDWLHEKNQDSSVTMMAESRKDQVLHSPATSKETDGFLNQDWPEKSQVSSSKSSNQRFETSPLPNSFTELMLSEDQPFITGEMTSNFQDLSGRDKSNNQREPSPLRNSFGDLMFGEDQPLSTEHFTNIQSYSPADTTEEMIKDKSSQVFQTEQSPLPSNSTEERINNTQESNEKSTKEVINIPDSPVNVRRSARKPPQKLSVVIFPYSPEDKPVRKFTVEVNASAKVEVLRKVLERNQQRFQLNLPEEGYFFIHNQVVLEDDKSFRSNGVAHGDSIEIFPGHVTNDDRPDDRRIRMVGR